MRRLEEQILTEKYRRIEGKLTFSVRLAELSVAPGEAAEGAFTIFASQEEIPAQGYVLTKDERMECKTEWFNGVQEKIVYRFCADGLQEGDSLQGQFLIVSDYGEYTLPWKVTVRREAAAGIAGKVSTLAGFTELARTDWKTAVQFFYSKPFAEICKKEGEKTWLLYRGLSAGYYNSSNVETFLEENGCKQALTFTAAKPEIQVKDVQETVREELQILKNGWGPVSLKVQTEDDFLFLEKNRIGEDDFLGNLCRLPVYISEEKLHDGKNFGTVTVSWSRGQLFGRCHSDPPENGTVCGNRKKKPPEKIYDPSDRALFKAARKADRPGRLAGKGAGMCGRTGCPGSEKYRAKAFFRTAVIDGKQNRRGRLDVKAAALDAGGRKPGGSSAIICI